MNRQKPNKYFLPDPRDLPQLVSPEGRPIPFAQLLAIDVDNISGEYEVHAAWLSTIGYAHAQAEADAEAKERAVKRKHAELFFHYTAALKEQQLKATVDAIESSILLDVDYQRLEDLAAEAALKSAILKNAFRAYSDRRDMLVNLGAEGRLERPRLLYRE